MNEQPGKEGRSEGRGRDSDNFIVQVKQELGRELQVIARVRDTYTAHRGRSSYGNKIGKNS